MAKKIFDIFPSKSNLLAKKERILITGREKKKSPFLIFGLSLIILSGTFLFLSFYFSRAEVELVPETKEVNFKTEVKIEKNPSKESIQGEFFEKEEELSKEFSSSGVIEKKEYAQGKIKVYNKSSKSITLIKNTRFLSDKGKQFHTLNKITIPAKGYLDGVEVRAAEAGEEYNIPPSKFSVPGLLGTPSYHLVYGESSESMKGGFIGKVFKVTEEDLKQAERILLEELFSLGKESLKKSIPPDYILLETLIKQEVIEKFPLTKVGQELKSFIFKAKIKSRGFVFKKSDLESFAKDFIYSQIEPQGEGTKRQKLVEESLNLNYSLKEKNLEKGKALLFLEVSGKVYSQLDFQILKEKIKGKSSVEGEYLLEKIPEISKVKIKISPFWIKTIPKNDEKIKIHLKVD